MTTTRTTDPAPVAQDRPETVSAPAAGTGRDRALPVLAIDIVASPDLLGRVAGLARDLEDSGASALTISDGGLHPIHVASHLAPLTSRAALLPRTDAVYVEPFHLATQLMSLDHISHGRAGWLITAETDPTVAATVGRAPLDLDATAHEAGEVLEASRLLWDSWADDAVVKDTARGVYVDAARLQYADHEGATFSVRGPAITPRSPQGLLPVLVADADRDPVGPAVTERLADGRALDVDVSGGAQAATVAEAISAAAEAAGSPVRLVRLVGLDLDADPAGIVSELAAELRRRTLIAPAPDAGQSLREQLGLPRPEVEIDPARRSDRARTARG